MSTLTDACEKLKVYVIFFRLWRYYVPTAEQAAPETQGGVGAQGTSPPPAIAAKPLGKGGPVPPWGQPGPPASPTCVSNGLVRHCILGEGKKEGIRKILLLLVPRQLLTSPSGVWFACTRDLDSPRALGLSRAWSFTDTELLQLLFTLCGVMKYCWKKKI